MYTLCKESIYISIHTILIFLHKEFICIFICILYINNYNLSICKRSIYFLYINLYLYISYIYFICSFIFFVIFLHIITFIIYIFVFIRYQIFLFSIPKSMMFKKK